MGVRGAALRPIITTRVCLVLLLPRQVGTVQRAVVVDTAADGVSLVAHTRSYTQVR